MKKLLIIVLLIAPITYAASNESTFDLSAFARKYLNNAGSSQETQTNAAANNSFNQNSLATFNTLLNETPDSFKSSLLDKVPTSIKVYLVKTIELVKPYLNEASIQSLQRLQNIVQQNIAATHQEEQTEIFQQSKQ